MTGMVLTKLKITPSVLKFGLNWFFPPWIGAGIRMQEISQDFRRVRVVMPLRFYNRNYVGSHYGGSLYSMCDPIYMLQLLNILGPEFIVWDMAATIAYKKPGKSTVHADFVIEDDLIDSLVRLKPDEKRIFDLSVDVKDEGGKLVATVIKTTYVKRKPSTT
jgi:acyl-coenzyme A thioesterase PaaI-like protein